MQGFITKIGKGLKRSRDLSWDDAKQAMVCLMEGEATQTQVGAFLMAMRFKMETVSELGVFTSVVRQYVPPIQVPQGLPIVDLPIYGEKHDTFHATVAAAIVAAAGGATVFLHGTENKSVPTNISRVLSDLGIQTDLSPLHISGALSDHHFAYLDIALYHPSLTRYLYLREEFGLQNLFHQVARMLNPTGAHSQVIGIAHPPYLEKMAEAVHMIDKGHLLIFQGVEGYPELSISTATLIRELNKGSIFPVNLKPMDVGLDLGAYTDMTVPSSTPGTPGPQQEANLIRRILHNEVKRKQTNWVILNAAMLLYAAGKASTITKGVFLARYLLESGAAAKKLRELVTTNRSLKEPAEQQEKIYV